MRLIPMLGVAAVTLAGCSSAEPVASGFPHKDRDATATELLSGPDWYRHAELYELNVRSFSDSDGDGIGDLPGVIQRLDYLKQTGVDGIWMMPIYPTPFVDSGYDVADYDAINPDYGTLDDFDKLVSEAHSRNIRVILDLVLNHTSDQHPWFVESRSSKTNPKANWYVWSDTQGTPDNTCGPSPGPFGDSAWTFDDTRQQYYFHRFYAGQPDLNYREPQVVKATLDAVRFWLERGVDGFRCDVIAYLFESANGCDLLPGTKDYIRQLRALLDEYPNRAMVAEPTDIDSTAGYYGNGHDMFHMTFNFAYASFWGLYFSGTTADSVKTIFTKAKTDLPAGAQMALTIGSHDISRAYTAAKGIRSRMERSAVIQHTMPGTPFVYNGEELGLEPGTQSVVDSRDFARTPMLWSSGAGYGFTTGKPWIGFGADADQTNLEVEQADDTSMYAFYKGLMSVRRGRAAFGSGSFDVVDAGDPSLLVYTRADADETYLVAVSFDEEGEHRATLAGVKPAATPERLIGAATLRGSPPALVVPPGGYGIFRIR